MNNVSVISGAGRVSVQVQNKQRLFLDVFGVMVDRLVKPRRGILLALACATYIICLHSYI